MQITAPDLRRLKELMLYVAQKSVGDRAFGATKLNKLLFYSDFLAHANLGTSITRMEYQRLAKGPAPRLLKPAERSLEEEGAAAVASQEHFGRTQRRLVAMREPDLTLFSAREIKLVDDIISALWGHNARSVSDLSHLEAGWKLARPGETIPYWTVFLHQDQQPDASDVEWAQRVIDHSA